MAASFSRQFMRAEKLAALGRSYEKRAGLRRPVVHSRTWNTQLSVLPNSSTSRSARSRSHP
jgi:hypothetical protein